MIKFKKIPLPIIITIYTFIVLFLISIFIRTGAQKAHLPITLFLQEVTKQFYFPSQNIINPGHIFNTNIYTHIYRIFFIVAVTLSFLNLAVKNCIGESPIKIRQIPLLIMTVFFIGITTFQMTNISQKFLMREKIISTKKKLTEKYRVMINPKVVSFCQFVQKKITEPRSAKFITDLNTAQDPGMLMHRQIAYFLYPIDIRGIRSEPVDVLILFEKKAAKNYVPEDFETVYSMNNNNLVAIKEKP